MGLAELSSQLWQGHKVLFRKLHCHHLTAPAEAAAICCSMLVAFGFDSAPA